jgi:hypothetical protein
MPDDNAEPRGTPPIANGTRRPAGAGRDEDTPNQASNKEPAEGSRDNTNTGAADRQPPD